MTQDGNYVIAGEVEPDVTQADYLILKIDSNGNLLWSKNFGLDKSLIVEELFHIFPDQNGGLIVTGTQTDFNFGGKISFYLAKLDGQGNLYTNYLAGNVFHDRNFDCTQTVSDEISFENWLIRIDNLSSGETLINDTDENGNYKILVDTGTYDVTVIPPNTLWEACEPLYTVTLDTFFGTTVLDFPMQPKPIAPF